jgi:outer membrane lipoprotein-sorting protein
MRIKSFLVLASSVSLFGFAAWQTAIPAPLALDFQRLTSSPSLHVGMEIRQTGEAPVAYQIALAKPNLFKITGPDGFVLSNGHVIYTYNKAKNTYFEAPLSDAEVAKVLKRPELLGWAAFFQKDPAAAVVAARAGGTRTVKGSVANDVEVSMRPLGLHATLYIDKAMGITRGYELSQGGKSYLALADSISLSQDAEPADAYAFVAPGGATKTEAPKPDDATYANVAAILSASCLPCHSASSRSGGYDLTSYAGVSVAVRPGNGSASPLVTSLRRNGPGRMPQGRAPLTEDQITQIQKWIDDGAKNN